MNDLALIALVAILIIVAVLVFVIYVLWKLKNAYMSEKTGGGDLIISDSEKLVFDGHNMIHDYLRGPIKNAETYDATLLAITKLVSQSLPKKEKHFVVKNKDSGETRDGEDLTRRITRISKEVPDITFHVAFAKKPDDKPNAASHYTKERDDFLAIHIAETAVHSHLARGYVVSHDKFRDFASFVKIAPFYDLPIKAGRTQKKKYVDPARFFDALDKPNLSDHLDFQFITREEALAIGVKSGDIRVEESNQYSIVYLVI